MIEKKDLRIGQCYKRIEGEDITWILILGFEGIYTIATFYYDNGKQHNGRNWIDGYLLEELDKSTLTILPLNIINLPQL